MKKMNWFGLGKKVWEITAGLAFTLAGSFVMFVTLSGETRKMAIIATAVALGVHYIHEVLKNDEE
jgi:HAMP domain-containing protein